MIVALFLEDQNKKPDRAGLSGVSPAAWGQVIFILNRQQNIL
jgi:hypothetical protein